MRLPVLLTGSVIFVAQTQLVLTQQPAPIDSCFECCEELFNDEGILAGENSFENGQRVGSCQQDGCGSASIEESPCGVDNGNIDEACEVGFDFLTTGTTSFQIDNDIELTDFFCVDGAIEDSFSPTPAPTPPTQAPVPETGAPTFDLGDEDNSILLIAGGGAGGAVVVLILLVLLYPSAEKRRRRLENGLSEVDGSEEEKPEAVNHTIARSLANTRRPKMPAMDDAAASTLGMSVAESIANLREADLKNKDVQATFEVLQDFRAEHSDEVTAVRGDVLLGLSPVDKDWWIVKEGKTGKVGLFPSEFLKEIFSNDDILTPDPVVEKPNEPEDIF